MHQTSEVIPAVPASDAALIDRVRAGDLQAYGDLVERYERMLLAAVLPIVRDRHAAQDVVQDVFVAGYMHLPRLRDGGKFGGWLLKVAQREAVRAARRLRRAGGAPLAIADAADQRASTPEPLLCDEEQRRLLDAVRGLPLHERLTLCLRYFDGHDVGTIARLTGRTVGTVTKRLSRALQRLRDQLQ